MNKIKYLLALIVFLATSCEIELKNDDTELPPTAIPQPVPRWLYHSISGLRL